MTCSVSRFPDASPSCGIPALRRTRRPPQPLYYGSPNRKRGLNHVAFTVRDIHEVIGGGIMMNKNASDTFIGPGRHPGLFRLFLVRQQPDRRRFEYYTNDDFLTENWRPRELEHSASPFTSGRWKVGSTTIPAASRKKPEAV